MARTALQLLVAQMVREPQETGPTWSQARVVVLDAMRRFIVGSKAWDRG